MSEQLYGLFLVWSVRLTLMLADDAAMLAFIFCQ
ncbi:hypothetical protein SAMN06265795_102314 [Noviherbaspirillum humi]|uniref:Uncharacterized protein n=1 Tax=Noviherbaspirillum humi TaxID=1688639 RepID=A0A239DPN4_9BURK|nr:hypothetical protein SAMN06265795_102314 [Noviherbaspirillum humi]